MTDTRDALMVAQTSDGRVVQRPLSPHLQIYRWPPTMLGSILNRATAIAISIGTILLVWWLAAAAAGPASFATVQSFIASPVGLIMLLGWTASLFYHFYAGLRHLAWDAVIGFEKRTLNPVTYIILGATAASTVLVWVVGFLVLGG